MGFANKLSIKSMVISFLLEVMFVWRYLASDEDLE